MMTAPAEVEVEHPRHSMAQHPVNKTADHLSTQQLKQQSSSADQWRIGSTTTPSHNDSIEQAPPMPMSPVSVGAGGGAPIEMASGDATAPNPNRSSYEDMLLEQPSNGVDAVLSAACDTVGFDIAELWLRTGPKTHQLINSHLRPTALEESVRNELMDVYYGDQSSERTHRLSPALCKRAKDCRDVVWVTAQTTSGAEALRNSINDVRTAVAVPICHAASNTNMTVIFFSIRRIVMKSPSVEFLVHMALGVGVASVNNLGDTTVTTPEARRLTVPYHQSKSEHVPKTSSSLLRPRVSQNISITGAKLDMQWTQLRFVEYLTDGGNSWIHSGMLDGKPVVIKTLKPECQDLAIAINEIESELAVHSRLSHPNVVDLVGAGVTSRGVRFVVMERLDGGTLTQRLGYDTRIRDRRRRFWRKKQISYMEVLKMARSIASAMAYLHDEAVPGSIVMHRDLKPDNCCFQLDGTVKLIDFGLAKILDNASSSSDDVYEMSGETGSLRYMAPEVAKVLPYNHKADVYSFGIILWELNTCKKPFEGLDRDSFYEHVVHGNERPPLKEKWPADLSALMQECWSSSVEQRPNFSDIVERLNALMSKERGGGSIRQKSIRKITGIIDRHSTWF